MSIIDGVMLGVGFVIAKLAIGIAIAAVILIIVAICALVTSIWERFQ